MPFLKYQRLVLLFFIYILTQSITNMANDAYQHTDFAIIIDYSLSKFVGCTTKEQVSEAIDNLIQQLSRANSRQLNYLLYFKRFYYAVEQEPNSWDILFASNSYIAYKWIYFTMVLVALLYTCARVIKLARLNMLKQNLFWLHLLLLFLVHLAALEKAYIASAFLNLYIILAKLPFDIIVWHWYVIVRYYITTFNDWFLVNIFQIISLIVTINHNKDYDTITPYTTPFIRFMRLVLPWVAIAIFCGLVTFSIY
ncbi:hypothetical protein BDF19DRAFT_461702 [Syncephalis fuscata]|nr:hypothetical protein BDF19DRAFT_461702 [Syncephalis fuscata]